MPVSAKDATDKFERWQGYVAPYCAILPMKLRDVITITILFLISLVCQFNRIFPSILLWVIGK